MFWAQNIKQNEQVHLDEYNLLGATLHIITVNLHDNKNSSNAKFYLKLIKKDLRKEIIKIKNLI